VKKIFEKDAEKSVIAPGQPGMITKMHAKRKTLQ